MTQVTLDQVMEMAVQHHQAGRLPEAEQLYRQILAQAPSHAQAIHHLGLIAHQVGKMDVALDLIRRAIILDPNHAESYSNLGTVLKEKGQLDEAFAAYQQAIALKPAYSQAHYNLGVVLASKKRFAEAIAAYRQAIGLNPGFADAHNNLGIALKSEGQLDDAITAYRRAIALRPHYAEAHSNLGVALKDKGMLDDAMASHRLAIAFGPNYAEAHSNFGTCAGLMGQLDEAIVAMRKAIALKPAAATLHSSVVYAVGFHPDYGPQEILQEAQRWARMHADPLAIHVRPHANNRSPDRPLRIGYVSPHFREQVVGSFLLPVLECSDRSKFESVCYSDVRNPDYLTERFQSLADRWRNIVDLPDEQVDRLIREDGIDILVDLTMHMAENRLLVFARKPAPVQVTWLAYPGTTGMSAIDYRLTDPYLDPPTATEGLRVASVRDSFYTERSVRLPDCWFCYRPHLEMPPVNALPALAAGQITFGCLNNFAKVSRETLRCWCGLMREVPDSRLLLHAHEGSHRQRVRDVLAGEGIDPARLRFAGLVPWAQYLRQYQEMDICLDPFPYSGGTTSCDALWMGVPVITLPGRTAVGRLSATILHNVGLSELIADSLEGYVRLARELAGDPSRLSQMRSGLRHRMMDSPLMDEPRFTRNLEAAYREMWRRWCLTAQ